MNPRQRRGLMLIMLAGVGALTVFFSVLTFVAEVNAKVGNYQTVVALTKQVDAYQEVTTDMVELREIPKKWLPDQAITDARDVVGLVPTNPLPAGTYAQRGMFVDRPGIARGNREVAILVDAETGVAGKIAPGDRVDILVTRNAGSQRTYQAAEVWVANALIIEVGLPEEVTRNSSNDNGFGSTSGRAVPVTFALRSRGAEAYANFAVKVRLLRGGGDTTGPAGSSCSDQPQRDSGGDENGSRLVSVRIVLVSEHAELREQFSGMLLEAHDLELVDVVTDPRDAALAAARDDIDVVIVDEALSTVSAGQLTRELVTARPFLAVVWIASPQRPEVYNQAMIAGARSVVLQPLSVESCRANLGAAAEWSRALRDHLGGTGLVGAHRGRVVALVGAKGGVGTTLLATLLAARSRAPGHAVVLVDLDLRHGAVGTTPTWWPAVDRRPRRGRPGAHQPVRAGGGRRPPQRADPGARPGGGRAGRGGHRAGGPADPRPPADAVRPRRRRLRQSPRRRHGDGAGGRRRRAARGDGRRGRAAGGPARGGGVEAAQRPGGDEHVSLVLNRVSGGLRSRPIGPADRARAVGHPDPGGLLQPRGAGEHRPAGGRPAGPRHRRHPGPELEQNRTGQDLAGGGRSRRSRVSIDAGQVVAELPLIIGAVCALGALAAQLLLFGVTHLFARHAADEGARVAAVTSDPKEIRKAVADGLPSGWGDGFSVSRPDGTTVQVTVHTPTLVPGLGRGLDVTTRANVLEERS